MPFSSTLESTGSCLSFPSITVIYPPCPKLLGTELRFSQGRIQLCIPICYFAFKHIKRFEEPFQTSFLEEIQSEEERVYAEMERQAKYLEVYTRLYLLLSNFLVLILHFEKLDMVIM
ncbi:hypothetical protein K1719_024381 [Acacia pycnantha]|nr:hypothetical protein K1719_024381 [Acacia pycnantha]